MGETQAYTVSCKHMIWLHTRDGAPGIGSIYLNATSTLHNLRSSPMPVWACKQFILLAKKFKQLFGNHCFSPPWLPYIFGDLIGRCSLWREPFYGLCDIPDKKVSPKISGGKNTFLQISLPSSADARDIGNLGDVSISLWMARSFS